MRVDEFARLMSESMPTKEQLVEYGLNDEEIEEIQRTFRCQRRGPTDAGSDPSSELERLVVDYDCSTLEVSQVRFSGAPEAHPQGGVVVGYWEADPIVVSKDGEVVALDHADQATSTPCAADSRLFLEAMACLVRARSNRLQWKGRAAELAEACAQEAGGDRYRAFFGALTAFVD
jgi:hypothetical protein